MYQDDQEQIRRRRQDGFLSSVDEHASKDNALSIENQNVGQSDSSTVISISQPADGISVEITVNKKTISESALTIGLQTLFPFLMAGLGMVGAGILLDRVQHWKVFQNMPEIFILVPALLGLKGNLEMTLASRLSTYANQKYLDDVKQCWSLSWANMVTVEAQAMVIAVVASLLAQILGWVASGAWKIEHAIVLCAGSMLTAAIASGVLGLVMIVVVVSSRRLGINPDNVATPIAASLGDLITLFLLANIVNTLYSIMHNPFLGWIGPTLLIIFVGLTPLLVWFSYSNPYTKHVMLNGWMPVLSAMAISSSGGFILNLSVVRFPGIAAFAPVVNGVGGNLVAIQASRTSSFLHTSGFPIGTLPEGHKGNTLTIWDTFTSNSIHAVGARVMLSLVLPGQIIFLFAIIALQSGSTKLSPTFVLLYLFIAFTQVAILLYICSWLVFLLWKYGQDPDNAAIPYLTGLGDLLGTALLAGAFYILFLLNDPSVRPAFLHRN